MEAGLYSGIREGTQDCYLQGRANGLMSQHQQISEVNTFIFTIKTTANRTFVLPLVSNGTYNFWVDWGDGRKDNVRGYGQTYTGETVVRTHTYPTALKNYTIKITGTCKGWSFNTLATQAVKLISIKRWGCLELIDDPIGNQFAGCTNLNLSNVVDTLNLGNATYLRLFFLNNTILQVNLINNWNISNITNIQFMFQNAAVFNSPLHSWDTSNVTVMDGLFYGCTLFDQSLNSWNVSKVTSMSNMFNLANAFDEDLSEWNVSNVTNMFSMFSNCSKFNNSLQAWASKVGKVTNMSNMFNSSFLYNQPMVNWRTSKVTTMANMFSGATAFDQNIGSWNLSACINLTNFMVDKTPSTFSATNLSAIYEGWVNNPLNDSLSISFGSARYLNTTDSIECRNLMSRPGITGASSVLISSISVIYTGVIKVTTAAPHGLPIDSSTGTKRIYIANAVTTNDSTYLNRLWTVTVYSATELILNTSNYSLAGALLSAGDVVISYGWTIVDGGTE
jgi:surface protein